MLTYCVKQRKKTNTVRPTYTMVRGRRMMKGVCAECGAKKAQFVKK